MITMSQHPVPTINADDQTTDWFNSLDRCLNWNERQEQGSLSLDTDDGLNMPSLDVALIGSDCSYDGDLNADSGDYENWGTISTNGVGTDSS